MKEYYRESYRILENDIMKNDDIFQYSDRKAQNPIRFHRSIPFYRETPLVSLKCAAKKHKVDSIFVKDESARFGLKAFKGLGGSYCMFRILCEKLGLDPFLSDYNTFLDDDIRSRCSNIEFATATDGNHGKGVSWAAKLFGCAAHVFMPKGTVEARRRAIEDAGSAAVQITDMNYDQTVRYTAELARQNDWILIQDTSWDGYEKYPVWIMEGYLTMAAEAEYQMGNKKPTHIFLQAGVGSMAGCIEAYFHTRQPGSEPSVTIVEPEAAACIYQSAGALDGSTHSVSGNPVTIMAGLNCGTPCKTIWPVLRDRSRFFCACQDIITEQGMRAYAAPEGSDSPVISGESGAVTYGLLLSILEDHDLRNIYKIDDSSVILLINTEGDTDPDDYKRVTG